VIGVYTNYNNPCTINEKNISNNNNFDSNVITMIENNNNEPTTPFMHEYFSNFCLF